MGSYSEFSFSLSPLFEVVFARGPLRGLFYALGIPPVYTAVVMFQHMHMPQQLLSCIEK